MKTITKVIILIGIIFSFAFTQAQDIYTASYNGDLETIKRLIEENPELVNSRNSLGRFPLEMAAQTGQIDIIKFLLENGADVNLNRVGATALHMAALYGGKTELIALLLEAGADINARTNNGETPLHYAKEAGHDDVVEYLEKKDADASDWTFLKLTGNYLDQSPPGVNPVIFSPGIVSAQEHFEHSMLAFSPDYTEIYWSSDFTEFGFYDIVYMKIENNRWSSPKLAPFSEKYHAGSPVFSSDGKKLYFSSTRPKHKGAGNSDTNIWIVEKTDKAWSEPKLLNEIINTDQNESVQSISKKGTLYFRRGMELFSANQKNGVFQTPEKLDIKLDADAKILALFIAPDESYMIMESFGGEGGYGGADLYISYRLKDASWSEPKNLGEQINTGDTERFPSVTPDGKYLFFLRVSDSSDFYWTSAKIIEELKPKESKSAKQDKFPGLKGVYLGQKPPGMSAEIFAPDIVSTEHSEFCSVFSPDGSEFYWSLSGAPYPVIVEMHQNNDRWSKPEIVPFSGKYLDYDMAFTPDGKQLFFCSQRPPDGISPPTDNTDIWFVERATTGWTEPKHVKGPVNSNAQEYYPIFAQNGTLYFSSTRPGGYGGADIYRARFVNGEFLEPENLGTSINTENFEGDLFIAPDESYIIVTCYGRSDSIGSGDLYISFRQENGSWSPMKNMGTSVNSAANEHCPVLSPDGKYLFFSSSRSRHQDYSKEAITLVKKIEIMNSWGNGRNEDIYWIDARIIDTLRSK